MASSTTSPAPPRPLATLRHHLSPVNTAEFSSCFGESSCLLSGDVSGKVAIWNVDRRRVIAEWTPHQENAILKIQDFGIDHSKILSQGRDGMVRIWDPSRIDISPKRAARHQSNSQQLPFEVGAFSSGSYNFCKCATMRWGYRHQTSTASSSTRQAQSEQSNQLDMKLKKHPGSSMLSQSLNAEDIIKKETLLSDHQTERPQDTNVLSDYENMIVCPCADSTTVGIWDVRNLKNDRPCLTFFDKGNDNNHKTGMLMCLRFTQCQELNSELTSNPIILAGYESGSLGLFDIKAGKRRCCIKVHEEPLLSLDVDKKGQQIVTSAADKHLHIVTLNYQLEFNQDKNEKNSSLLSLQSIDKSKKNSMGVIEDNYQTNGWLLEQAGVEAIALRSRQDLFVTGGWDRRIRVFEWNAPHRPLAVLKHHTAGVCAVSWNHDGSLLASASKDGNIAIWSIFQPPQPQCSGE